MSNDDKRLPGGVRRVSHKDRKHEISGTKPLFPPDDLPEEIPSEAASSTPDDLPLADDLFVSADAIPFDDMASALEQALSDAPLTEPFPLDSLSQPAAPPAPDHVESQSPTSWANSLGERSSPGDSPERFPPLRPLEPLEVEPPVPMPHKRGIARQDAVTIFFLVATVVMAIYFVILWRDPWSPLNPLPPATPFVVVTATSPGTGLMNAPSTLVEGTPLAFETPTLIPLSVGTPPPAATALAFPFALVDSGVLYAPNANGRGCNWSSIAGSVTGMKGEALNGYAIEITGDQIEEKVFSGTAQSYGAGGFELFLNGVPQQAQYTVRLFSPTGAPLSDKYPVVTSDQCEQNVAVVNFVQKRGI
jgi:hypothetical protein